MKKIILFILILALHSCEQKPLTQEEIYNKCSSGVALVKVEYYATADLGDGKHICLADKSIGLDESKFEPTTKYGTAFFVSDKGELVTNRHVVDVDYEQSLQSCQNLIEYIIKSSSETLERIREALEEIENQTYTTQEELDYLKGLYQYGKYKCDSIVNEINCLKSITLNNLVKHSKISIAYKSIDFQPCELIRQSKTVDLALIKLNSATTPPNCHIFTIPEKEKPTTKLYMIGFNHGEELGNTTEGLKAQITEGNISQKTDDIKMLYSIPALPGSSGSPVVNQFGELAAINFAGISNTQSFNYGIKAKNLVDLLGQ